MKIGETSFRTIWIKKDDPSAIQIIDQRFLPHKLVIEDIRSVDAMAIAIRDMHLRGAPLIGAAAAYGVYLACLEALKAPSFEISVYEAAEKLKATRPTAVNLVWGLMRQLEAITFGKTPEEKTQIAFETAQHIADDDVQICRKIGENGIKIIEAIASRKQGGVVNIMTHCNAGWLACVDWGTATAPIYLAFEKGIKVHVWVSETRPRNQGASLTAWELSQHGVSNTLIADNAAGHLMQHGRVDFVIVGTDRTTREGDVANKIGTYLKALAADASGIPFYVAVPSSSIDWNLREGVYGIPIEERNPDEIKWMEGLKDGQIHRVLVTREDQRALNPAFDVTPSHLITGLITERGIAEANEESLLKLFPEQNISEKQEPADGVIKFQCRWLKTGPIEKKRLEKINQCRQELFQLGLIGEYPNGIGYGNLSIRSRESRQFVITGTQTGGIPELESRHYTEIIDYDIDQNQVVCKGPIQASSESLTHAMIYELDPAIQAVVHVHQPQLWRDLLNKVPTTIQSVAYGTPDMAREVRRLYQETDLAQKKIMVMAGHEEGIITFGKNLEEASQALFAYMKETKI